MSETSPDKSPLEAFLEQYWKDREAGVQRSLDEYVEMFPGDIEGLATEFLGLRLAHDGDSTEPVADRKDPATVDRLGPYDLGEELGRGAQGVVYKATNTRTGGRVAVKVLRGVGPGAEELLLRFKREAQAAAKADHPGVCTVYDAEIDSGIPYIAMRYVEGETLAKRIARTREEAQTKEELSAVVQLDEVDFDDEPDTEPDSTPTSSGPQTRSDIMRAVHLVEKAARALHAVHEAGVIHRDVKPGNIMITPDGEAVVMDFGLARDDDSDLQTLTRSGDLFGTPAYMSPEQLTRQSIRLDRRTDVWSLGVMLYECVTLSRPFVAPSREGLYRQILAKEPEAPKRRNSAVSADLATVISTALQKDCDRRYQTALDLAEDLRRVRSYEPIAATPVGVCTRIARWAQRNPVVAGLSLLVLFGLGVSLVALVKLSRSNQDLDEQSRAASSRSRELLIANKEIAATAAENASLLQEATSAKLHALAQAQARADPGMAIRLALDSRHEQVAKTDQLLRDLVTTARALLCVHLPGNICVFSRTRSVTSLRFGPHGKRLAAATSRRVHVLHTVSGRIVAEIQSKGGDFRCMAFSPDGSRLLTGWSDGALQVDHLDSGQSVSLPKQATAIRAVDFARTDRLAAASANHLLLLSTTGHVLTRIKADDVSAVAFSHDGRNLVGVGPSAIHLCLPERQAGSSSGSTSTMTLAPISGTEFAARFSSDSKSVTVVSNLGHVATTTLDSLRRRERRLWDSSGNRMLPPIALAGARGFVGGAYTDPALWTSAAERAFSFSEASIFTDSALAASDDGRVIAMSSGAAALVLDATERRQIAELGAHGRFHGGGIASVAVSPDGTKVATGTAEQGLVRIWTTNLASHQVNIRSNPGDRVIVAPTGTLITTLGTTTTLWNAADGSRVKDLPLDGTKGKCGSFQFFRKGGRAAYTIGNTVYQLDLKSLQSSVLQRTQLPWVGHLAVDQRGTTVLTGNSSLISVADTQAGSEVLRIEANDFLPRASQGHYILGATMSSDASTLTCWGRRIADRTQQDFVIRRVAEDEVIDALTGESFESSFSPDGHWAAAVWSPVGQKSLLTVWDLRAGNRAWELDHVTQAGICPSSKRIAIIRSVDGTSSLELKDIASGSVLGRASSSIAIGGPVHWSSDGRLIVTNAGGYQAGVWDAETMTLSTVTAREKTLLLSAHPSPDADYIITSDYAGTIRVQPLDIVEIAKRYCTRDYTPTELGLYGFATPEQVSRLIDVFLSAQNEQEVVVALDAGQALPPIVRRAARFWAKSQSWTPRR